MQAKWLVATAVLLPPAVPSWADDIGTVYLHLSSPHDNNPTYDANPATGVIDYSGTIPSTIPLTVRFSATTAGADGANSGVWGLYVDLTGTALGDQTGKTMSLNKTFKVAMGLASSTTSGSLVWIGPDGLGFDCMQNVGSGSLGKITGFGAAQAMPGSENFAYMDAQYAGHPAGSHPTKATNGGLPLGGNEQYVEAVGPVVAATGTLNLAGAGTINLTGVVSLWAAGGNEVLPAQVVNDSLVIQTPEPASVLLVGPIGLLLLRRRR